MTNKIFSVILFAYTEGLGVWCARPPTLCKTSDSKSAEQLGVALDIAKQCLSKFKEPVNSIEHAETKSCEAIRLLTRRYAHDYHVVLHYPLGLILRYCSSVRSIPRASYYTGEQDPSNEDELRALSRDIVHTEYTRLVGT